MTDNNAHAQGLEYRKTATIKAVQFHKLGDHPAVGLYDDIQASGEPTFWVNTLEGGHIVTPGDWIATGIQGEHWPIKPDIFAATYEPVVMDFSDAIDPNAAHNRRIRTPAPASGEVGEPVAWMYRYKVRYVPKLECTKPIPDKIALSVSRWDDAEARHWTETPLYTADILERLAGPVQQAGGDHVGWQTMESAPKDGTEVLGYRPDCGVLLMRWTCLGEFLTDAELAEIDEETTYREDWFYADFVAGGRLEGTELPTLWKPLDPPSLDGEG